MPIELQSLSLQPLTGMKKVVMSRVPTDEGGRHLLQVPVEGVPFRLKFLAIVLKHLSLVTGFMEIFLLSQEVNGAGRALRV